MSSSIRITEKTVNDRDVIAFSKSYADEEHEVFAPEEQGAQMLLDLIATVNRGKANSDQFVLVRKSEVGAL
jgi:hypothetical protein